MFDFETLIGYLEKVDASHECSWVARIKRTILMIPWTPERGLAVAMEEQQGKDYSSIFSCARLDLFVCRKQRLVCFFVRAGLSVLEPYAPCHPCLLNPAGIVIHCPCILRGCGLCEAEQPSMGRE